VSVDAPLDDEVVGDLLGLRLRQRTFAHVVSFLRARYTLKLAR